MLKKTAAPLAGSFLILIFCEYEDLSGTYIDAYFLGRQLKNKIKYFLSPYQRILIALCIAVALPLDLGTNNGNLLKFERLGYRVTILLYCDCCLTTGNQRLCHTSTL